MKSDCSEAAQRTQDGSTVCLWLSAGVTMHCLFDMICLVGLPSVVIITTVCSECCGMNVLKEYSNVPLLYSLNRLSLLNKLCLLCVNSEM